MCPASFTLNNTRMLFEAAIFVCFITDDWPQNFGSLRHTNPGVSCVKKIKSEKAMVVLRGSKPLPDSPETFTFIQYPATRLRNILVP